MTADICDLDELGPGRARKDCWCDLLVDGQAGAALDLSGLILSFVGFDQTQTLQTEEALNGLPRLHPGATGTAIDLQCGL